MEAEAVVISRLCFRAGPGFISLKLICLTVCLTRAKFIRHWTRIFYKKRRNLNS